MQLKEIVLPHFSFISADVGKREREREREERGREGRKFNKI